MFVFFLSASCFRFLKEQERAELKSEALNQTSSLCIDPQDAPTLQNRGPHELTLHTDLKDSGYRNLLPTF